MEMFIVEGVFGGVQAPEAASFLFQVRERGRFRYSEPLVQKFFFFALFDNTAEFLGLDFDVDGVDEGPQTFADLKFHVVLSEYLDLIF